MSGFTLHEQDGLQWLTADLISARHAFTTRTGGVSEGVFESLNLGGNRGDAPEAVLENHRLLSDALGFDTAQAVRLDQVHGASVHLARPGDARLPFGPGVCPADAVITTTPGLPVLVLIADCVPVLLHDAAAGVAAAVHCGWRSSVADILGETIARMQQQGASLPNLHAAVGPAIGLCCFETGPEVYEALCAWLGTDTADAYARAVPETGKYMIDLPGANRARLLQLGLDPAHIAHSGICTRCHPDLFWSHRRCGTQRGTQAAIIML